MLVDVKTVPELRGGVGGSQSAEEMFSFCAHRTHHDPHAVLVNLQGWDRQAWIHKSSTRYGLLLSRSKTKGGPSRHEMTHIFTEFTTNTRFEIRIHCRSLRPAEKLHRLLHACSVCTSLPGTRSRFSAFLLNFSPRDSNEPRHCSLNIVRFLKTAGISRRA